MSTEQPPGPHGNGYRKGPVLLRGGQVPRTTSDQRLLASGNEPDWVHGDPWRVMHHPPRVTVHPVGLVAAGQQALVAGRPGHLAAAQQDRALAVPVAVRARGLLSAHGPTLGVLAHDVGDAGVEA